MGGACRSEKPPDRAFISGVKRLTEEHGRPGHSRRNLQTRAQPRRPRLAEQPELEVVFGSDGPKLAGGILTLPHPPRDPSGNESASLRGQADRLALRLANHDAGIDARMRPADTQAAEVFDAVEQARVEAVGSEFLAGVRDNLDAAW